MNEAIPWYKSQVLVSALVTVISSVLAIAGKRDLISDEIITSFVQGVFELVAVGSGLWTLIARLLSPVQKVTLTKESADRQSGVIRGLMLACMLTFTVPIVLTLSACSGVQAAYQAANEPDEYAFVLAEHYASLVKQAADLKERPTTPRAAVEVMQAAELTARPFVEKLRPLRDAYVAGRSAQTQQELQEAINAAVTAIADLIRAIQSAKGTTTTTELDDRILKHAELIEVSLS